MVKIKDNGIICSSESTWNIARKRAKLLCPIAEGKVSKTSKSVKTAALKLKLSERTIYNYLKKWKKSNGSILVFTGNKSNGGKNKSRLRKEVEEIVNQAIDKEYLSKQRITTSSLYRLIRERCLKEKIIPPSINTVRARINKLDYLKMTSKREGKNALNKFKVVLGSFPKVQNPLEVIQIDHTLVDIIIVDSYHRKPIGRPWITVAIDVYTRCIVGIYLTLDSPSATSIGMCLSNVVIDKSYWLEKIGAKVSWPIGGKPLNIYVDNGTDFHSEALRRGCEVHGIKISYRPIGSPHYGGIVERVIGTMMNMIHELPGTTFSNIVKRRDYQSDIKAILTIQELEKWFVMAIALYHQSIHSTFKRPPISLWNDAIVNGWNPDYVENPKNFLVDFLPIVYRKIQRHGFVVNHIAYMSNSLKSWVGNIRDGSKFIIRYDPRDLSKIYVLEPNDKHYIEIPYANIENIPINIWEHKVATKELRDSGKKEVNEMEIMRIIKEMRIITKNATYKSKKARRIIVKNNEHFKNLVNKKSPKLKVPTDNIVIAKNIDPFKDIEEW